MDGDCAWREAVVYQIYPRSFNDSDSDGIGDLRGIVERVDYLAALGVDVVWLTPVYDSPQVDNGYDIRDYRSIHDAYGTMADWTALRDALHERDIHLVMDLAVNHTSDEHEWFCRSRRGDEAYRDYYVWEPGEPDEPPNNWESLFGGSAWTYDETRAAWYLHLFDERMPDLNWRTPAVRDDVSELMNWWLERGIDGFRLDVINLLSKPAGLPDGDPAASITGAGHFVDGPRIHEYVRELRDRVFAADDVMTVGETFDVTPAEARRYVVEDGLDMVFPFEHMDIDAGGSGPWDIADWELADLKAVTERWQTAVGDGWIGLYLSNHDQPRLVSRFGDEAYRTESATMLATYLFTLRGTPFVYQGQELGMTNPRFESIDEYRDPATVLRVERAVQTGDIDAFAEIRDAVNYWSRDNARTPMQWSDAEHTGFTDGTPWIKVNANYPEVNVERESASEDSVLSYYRRLIDVRAAHPVLVHGRYEPIAPDDPNVFAYRRLADDADEQVLVALNFTDGRRDLLEIDGERQRSSRTETGGASMAAFGALEREDAELLLRNYGPTASDEPGSVALRPYEARIYRLATE
ncbi:glycoside hydrolase family 13 protein [Natrinema sp. 74]|uniref:glycoside hydrolase family 13 protein n=1 Tax=Natrinema sp. 74 TaxID=3384159 RepID=UPI0038D511A4